MKTIFIITIFTMVFTLVGIIILPKIFPEKNNSVYYKVILIILSTMYVLSWVSFVINPSFPKRKKKKNKDK